MLVPSPRSIFIALSCFALCACSAGSSGGPPSDAGTGGQPATGGKSGGSGGAPAATGGTPAASGGTVGSGGVPGTGGSGASGTIIAGCTQLCTTILQAACPNGPDLADCVNNCATAGERCQAAQDCFTCSGTQPRVVCGDAGEPEVPDCPECADIADRCTGVDGSVDSGAGKEAGAKDASTDGEAPKTDAAVVDAGPDSAHEKAH